MKSKWDGKVGTRELAAMIMIIFIIKTTDSTPIILFRGAGSAGWISALVAAGVILFILMLIFKLLKIYENKGLIDIIYHLTGKYFGLAIGMALFFMGFLALILNSISYVDIMSAMFFPQTPPIVLYAILIGSIYVIANRGLESIGRGAWIMFPILQAVFTIFVVFTDKDTHLAYIFPIAGKGVLSILKTGLFESSVFGEVVFFSVVFQFSRGYKDYKKACLIALGISTFEFVVMMLIYLTSFDYPSVLHVNYPFQEISRLADVGEHFKNPEAFFLGFWIISAILRFAIYLYVTTASFGYTIKLKEFEPLLLPFAGLTLMLGIIPENYIKTIYVFRNNFLNMSWVFLITLPVVLLAMSKLKGDFK